MERLIVDREEDRAEEAWSDQIVEQLREFLRVTILDDPEEHGSAEILLHLPALEGFGEVVDVVVFDEEINTLGGKLPLARLEQVEDGVPTLDGVSVLNKLEKTG